MHACGTLEMDPTARSGAPVLSLTDANINPRSGLSTDYLNHFNEAIMLLEMAAQAPDCLEDFFTWQPLTYTEHFAASRLKQSEMAIAAYESADPELREGLDTLANTMTMILVVTRDAMLAGLPAQDADRLARRTVDTLKPLVMRAGAVINGSVEAATMPVEVRPQDVVDALMRP